MVSAIASIATGIVLFVLKSNIADLRKYRSEREDKEKAKDELLLGMARVMLLDNYNRCEEKGFYTTGERDVYGELFTAYKTCGGNGVMDQIAIKLKDFPTKTATE